MGVWFSCLTHTSAFNIWFNNRFENFLRFYDRIVAGILRWPVATLAAFSMASENLAFAHGTKFSDPDLRSWESLGSGGVVSDVVVWTG